MSVAPDAIAIIGMAGRFPGSANIDEYWANLLAGRHGISELSDEQLRASGIAEWEATHPRLVKLAPMLDGVADFDAPLFGFTEREAQVRDPQQRLFLETAHAALEHAGVDPAAIAPCRVGVYAGGAFNRYGDLHVRRNATAQRSYGELGIQTSNHNDYIATLVAYKLGLTGPALSVATACSTSLVAIHLAAQAIRAGDCEVAIAGGVEVEMPYGGGHRWLEGGINSPDGFTRSYDADAAGTAFGSGVGAVVLKLLSDALRDGDNVVAVLRGSAIGNDGNRKVGFTAPGVEGQTAVVGEALAVAELDAGTIGYVEGHGTGTALGDPIEVQALTTAFRRHTDRTGYCVLGSVKSNIGHLGPAAGVAGVIKAALAVAHGQIPATVHFQRPNPRMDLPSTPFVVSGETVPFPTAAHPRRAGVSSFGMGGTNAHVLLEQPPTRPAAPEHDGPVLLTVSAATASALAASAERLAGHLATTTDGLAEVAHTLATGRRALPYRATVVAADHDEAASRLTAVADVDAASPVSADAAVAFVFPGQGSQYPGMAAGLYEALPTFRAELDRCLDVLAGELPVDLRALLLRARPDDRDAERELTSTEITQPALFAVEWALAAQLTAWGVRPTAGMLGHSVGELVAATVAGVFPLDDALRLVATRGRLVQAAAPGAMLAVSLPPDELTRWLDRTELAVVNGARSCVLAGTVEAVAEVAAELERAGQRCTRLRTSHAFHSRLVAPAAAPFAAAVAAVPRQEPTGRWVSNVTGTWITAEQAVDPSYWASQLRGTVLFHDGVRSLTASGSPALLEVGPGQALTPQLRRDPTLRSRRLPVLPVTAHQRDAGASLTTLLDAVGQLWALGVGVDRAAVDRELTPGRGVVVLPTYPFERRRYWIDPDPAPVASPPASAASAASSLLPDVAAGWLPGAPAVSDSDVAAGGLSGGPAGPAPLSAIPMVDDRLTVPGWRQLPPLGAGLPDVADRSWLVLLDGDEAAGGLGSALRERLVAAGARVSVAPLPDGELDLDAARALLAGCGDGPVEVVHCWTAGDRPDGLDEPAAAAHWHRLGFLPLLRVIQAAARDRATTPVRITAITTDLWDVAGETVTEPGKATLTGLLAVAAKESEHLSTRVIDGSDPDSVLVELSTVDGPDQVALRSGRRWVRHHLPVDEPVDAGFARLVRPGGVYVITGGLGALGLVAARELAAAATGVRLALLGRGGLPERERWGSVTEPRQLQAVAAVRELEAAGATVLPLAADVADRAGLAAALDKVRAELGEIAGVVHSAGIAGGGLAAVKDPAVAHAVLAPKTTGTLLLDELCGELDFFVLFSSIAAVTHDFGLSDYAGANAFQDAFAHRRARTRGGRTLSINWPSWAEVGMAVDNAGSASSVLRAMQGARLHPLLHKRLPADPAHDEGVLRFETVLDERDWPLDEHRIYGSSVLPGTAYLELALAALTAADPGDGPAELTDVAFAAPLSVPGRRTVITRLEPRRGGWWRFEIRTDGDDGALHASGRMARCAESPLPPVDLDALRAGCDTTIDPPDYNGGSGLVHVGPRWLNVLGSVSGTDASAAGGEAAGGSGASGATAGGAASGAAAGGVVVSELRLPDEFVGDLAGYHLHPALLDGATAFSVDTPVAALPFAYRRVVVHGRLPQRFHSVLRVGEGDGRHLVVRDVRLVDPDGHSLVEITGFTMRVVDRELVRRSVTTTPDATTPAVSVDSTGNPAQQATVSRTAASGAAASVDGEDSGVRAGALSTAEGARLFRALLGTDLGPQVVVAADSLAGKLSRAAAVTAGSLTGALTRPRPAAVAAAAPAVMPAASGVNGGVVIGAVGGAVAEVASDGVSETERVLIVLWQELLGGVVERDSDFFDLGGDSLVAVQLTARIEAEMGVLLPITALFDTPTVAELAAMIDQRRT